MQITREQLKGDYNGTELDVLINTYLDKVNAKQYDEALALITAHPGKGKIFLWRDSQANEVIELLDLLFGEGRTPRVTTNIAGLYNLYGLAFRDRGDLDQSIEYLEKALAIETDPVSRTEILCDITGPYRTKGDNERAIEYAGQALKTADSIQRDEDREYWRGIALRILGHSETIIGRYDDAERHLREALAIWERYSATRPNDRQSEGMVNAFLARLFLLKGETTETFDLPKAKMHAKKALELAESQKFSRDYTRAQVLLAEIALRENNIPEAEQLLSQALQNAEEHEIAEQLGEALLIKVRLHIVTGDILKAQETATRIKTDPQFNQFKDLQNRLRGILL